MKIKSISTTQDRNGNPIVYGLGENDMVYQWHENGGVWRELWSEYKEPETGGAVFINPAAY